MIRLSHYYNKLERCLIHHRQTVCSTVLQREILVRKSTRQGVALISIIFMWDKAGAYHTKWKYGRTAGHSISTVLVTLPVICIVYTLLK